MQGSQGRSQGGFQGFRNPIPLPASHTSILHCVNQVRGTSQQYLSLTKQLSVIWNTPLKNAGYVPGSHITLVSGLHRDCSVGQRYPSHHI